MADAAVAFAAFAAFAMLALAMPRHRRDAAGRLVAPAPLCRVAGWALLAASVMMALGSGDAARGAIGWFGWAMLAALTVGMGMTYRPRWVGPAAWIGAVAAGLAAIAPG